MPDSHFQDSKNYQRIAKAIEYLEHNRLAQPALEDLSAHIGLSEAHLQRVFSEWAGVSPKQFLQFLTKEDAKRRLRSATVLDATLASGLSGSSRLHDLMLTCEGVTPGEYRTRGKGVAIAYGIHPSPFGQCFIATTQRGVCKLAFFDESSEREQLERELRAEWSEAKVQRDDRATEEVAHTAFPPSLVERAPLHLLLKGTPFQLRVWEALLAIPPGEVVSYQRVATSIGAPSATRAVASAIAKNHIAHLIPCHRVIRKDGGVGGYRWGEVRKRAILAREACR